MTRRHRQMILATAVAIVATVAVVMIPLTMHSQESNMSYNKLTPEEKQVIIDKGTERPFTGKYCNFKEAGTYTCKQCGAALYRSDDKFESGCGWPSFDDEIEGAVTRTTDADGHRTEITCANCGAHLGHVFLGEGFTAKDTRHCVNSISLNFVPAESEETAAAVDEQRAYFAGGCFWGTEYLLQQVDGVISTDVGYMGGDVKNPTYRQVCDGNTGHAETVEVVFDANKVDYETLTRMFFEIHDPTQVDRQGPDRGNQYRSAVFFTDHKQQEITRKLIGLLEDKGYKVATEVAPAGTFWTAEDYHQDYYKHTGKQPYCHWYTKRF